MEEQYFMTRMLIMTGGAMLAVLVLIGYAAVSLWEKVRKKRDRRRLAKSLKQKLK